ncbi:MarR family transcriptional regulator [Burkholderia cenocepacia]|uniref:MarR family winged helix-turn-helix transcriptional regulator n=1 Tax=Burkholderia cenocepacia TaxID=95486 RepID=UPI0028650B3D|nr:MarR family transcriptional regulator [Burkholderia cenocepacia]
MNKIAASHHLISKCGVTPQQGCITLLLSNGRCFTASGIARVLGMDASAATRLLDRLEKRGLVNRVRSDPDRRVIRVVLTEEGRLISARVPSMLESVTQMSLAGCSTEEMVTFKTMLRRILSNVND